MNMCFRKILVFASLFFVLILLFVSCDSREVLNITYVIGEYGIITNDAPITQRIVNPYDLIIPIVVGKDGYFFSGFIVDAVGNNRKYIATYYEVETYFVDRTTEERVEDFTVIDITRTFVETKDYPVAPYVAISFRNMQTNAFSLYYCLAENSDMPLQVRKDDPDEDHYLSFSTRTGEMNFEESPYDMSEFLNNEHYLLLIDKSSGKIETSSYYEHFGRYGFEANLYFEFELTVGTYSGVMASLVVPVKCDHFKVLSIDIKSTYPINDVPYPIKPSMIVPLHGFTHQEILYEYEEDNIVGFDYIGIIERIYTANGHEIEPARFDEYAYFRTRGNAVQLTDKVEPGYKIQLHLYYERDNVTSNTFTIVVS